MGTYNLSKQEIYDAVTNCLDTLEGDFTRQILIETLDEIKKDYKYVSDEVKKKKIRSK